MKRAISETEYIIQATEFSNALDYPFVLSRQSKILENKLWLVVENLYPYQEFDKRKVESHLLIIPKRNDIKQFWQLKSQELKSLKHIEEMLAGEFAFYKNNPQYTIAKYQKINDKSLEKLHIHFLIIKK